MSVSMDLGVDALLQAAQAEEALNEVEVGDDDREDGSSSLSEIEDNNIDEEEDEDLEGSEDLSNPSENDSEAETERLEESPIKFRQQQDLVMSSQNYKHSPSKLNKQISPTDMDMEEDDEDDDPLSSDDISHNESPDSPKSSEQGEAELEPTTAATYLDEPSGDIVKTLLSASDADTRKRKRSIMAGTSLDDDLEEPLRKRTGSVMTPGRDYAVEDEANPDYEEQLSNPISGNVSGEEGEATQENEGPEEAGDAVVPEELAPEIIDAPTSPKRRGRKKKKVVENGIGGREDPDADVAVNGDHEVRNGEEGSAENEGYDEVEAANKNEEELEKKRIALEQLSAIERQFTAFRDRVYDERLEQLNREEAMLRQNKITHPDYLAMIQCIDARRDDKLRIADNLRTLEMQNLRNHSVAKRSQILVQYQQEVREIRERKLEQLGKQWYEIQHDRRNHAGSIPDYTLKYPATKAQQVQNQMAYNTEVSILSGVAKYVGFPAAPTMASATAAELEDDFEKMGRTRQAQPMPVPMQELQALRNAGSRSRFKPAEEQFIEQTPWANPQHPSHAHLLQRQTPAQQTPRTSTQAPARRHSHQPGVQPISGTFSNNSSSTMTGRISPHNPFVNSHSHTIVPSPLGSRQPSLSPQQNRHPPSHSQDFPKSNIVHHHSPPAGPSEVPREFAHEVRREQAAAMMGRF
ncbi:uncharacterized protein L3040_005192 [Drepanopeziza brunnea f. sp. 'multigermtubi']|uniref:uncharacterized protein n=1 Tax=Drepanopeziza brunnea f. sp. 'multigermtubi' TaxID=698441 RepID=UPI002385E786|nr:hypothetical protein L3040_005192 [Drepanopeziza brunnea f. sp. 'multigermtubi']